MVGRWDRAAFAPWGGWKRPLLTALRAATPSPGPRLSALERLWANLVPAARESVPSFGSLSRAYAPYSSFFAFHTQPMAASSSRATPAARMGAVPMPPVEGNS